MAEHLFAEQNMRVRFSLPAPKDESMDYSKVKFTVSARGKEDISILEFLFKYFPEYCGKISTVWGFVEHCSLYGGRVFVKREISETDVNELYDAGIGLKLPISSVTATHDDYIASKEFLRKYHVDGNSVIVVRDDLAEWIKNDFPKYKVEASAIKNIKTLDSIQEASKLYDSIVLRSFMNDNPDFLINIPNKDQITLFLTYGCSHGCNSKICYTDMSRVNVVPPEQRGEFVIRCSQEKFPEPDVYYNWDIDPFVAMGFSSFKVMRKRNSRNSF